MYVGSSTTAEDCAARVDVDRRVALEVNRAAVGVEVAVKVTASVDVEVVVDITESVTGTDSEQEAGPAVVTEMTVGVWMSSVSAAAAEAAVAGTTNASAITGDVTSAPSLDTRVESPIHHEKNYKYLQNFSSIFCWLYWNAGSTTTMFASI